MGERFKMSVAFSVIGILIIVGFLLVNADKPTDVYPTDDTVISLYGEAHGSKTYYDIELSLWEEQYADGARNLFCELPYYSAEFLNIWMKEDSDEILDQFYEDIQGTQSGNEYYLELLHKIKESCPETIFYGTDVGHQNETTGQRYLAYLEENGLKDSENYRLAEECMRQGEEFLADDKAGTGISDVREAYMVSNFIEAYERCGGGKVMGIYGSYHTELNVPNRMASSLKDHFGDVISSVTMSTLATKVEPYKPGVSITGLVFLLMLVIPNLIWAKKAKPAGYDEVAKKENKVLVGFEKTGQVLVTAALLVFPAINPQMVLLPEGFFVSMKIYFWVLAFVLMILYEFYWIRYFRSKRTLKDMYSSFAGIPVAGAELPVMAVLLLGLYSENLLILIAGIILEIGHVGIHLMHYRDLTGNVMING